MEYPLHGVELIPVVFETGARPGDAAVAYVRSLAHSLEGAARTEVLRCAWQQFSCLLQVGSAEALLAAIGTLRLGPQITGTPAQQHQRNELHHSDHDCDQRRPRHHGEQYEGD